MTPQKFIFCLVILLQAYQTTCYRQHKFYSGGSALYSREGFFCDNGCCGYGSNGRCCSGSSGSGSGSSGSGSGSDSGSSVVATISKTVNIGIIVGAVVGGLIFLIICVIIIVVICKVANRGSTRTTGRVITNQPNSAVTASAPPNLANIPADNRYPSYDPTSQYSHPEYSPNMNMSSQPPIVAPPQHSEYPIKDDRV